MHCLETLPSTSAQGWHNFKSQGHAVRGTRRRLVRACVRPKSFPFIPYAATSASNTPDTNMGQSQALHPSKPTVGDVFELECLRLALEGKGVCLLPPSNFVVLCSRALPGEKLVAEITLVKKGYAEARKLSTLTPHHHAVVPPCPHFGPCGGCSLQSLAYEAQLQEKQNQVIQTLKRVGKLEGVEHIIKPIIGCNPLVPPNPILDRARALSMDSNSEMAKCSSSGDVDTNSSNEPNSSSEKVNISIGMAESSNCGSESNETCSGNEASRNIGLAYSCSSESSETNSSGSGTCCGSEASSNIGMANSCSSESSETNSSGDETCCGSETSSNIGMANSCSSESSETNSSGNETSGSTEMASSSDSGSGIFGYRNKMQFTFSSLCWVPKATGDDTLGSGIQGATPDGRVVSRPVLGFLRPGSQAEVLPITKCWLQDETANTILETVRTCALGMYGLLPHNDPCGQGFLKHLVIRSAQLAPVHQQRQWQPAVAQKQEQGHGQYQHPQDQYALHLFNQQQPALTSQHRTQHEHRHNDGSLPTTRTCKQGDKDYLVTFVITSSDGVQALQPVAAALVAAIPQVVGVVVKVSEPSPQLSTPLTSSSAMGPLENKKKQLTKGVRSRKVSTKVKKSPRQQLEEQEFEEPVCKGWSGRASGIRLLAGSRPYLIEFLRGLHLRVSPDSFLQTNTAQAEVLYKIVADATQLQPSDSLLDLFCGAGSIGLSLAGQCKHVVGYEAEGAAIIDAYHNAVTNGIRNASFSCVDLTTGVPDPGDEKGLLLKAAAANRPRDGHWFQLMEPAADKVGDVHELQIRTNAATTPHLNLTKDQPLTEQGSKAPTPHEQQQHAASIPHPIDLDSCQPFPELHGGTDAVGMQPSIPHLTDVASGPRAGLREQQVEATQLGITAIQQPACMEMSSTDEHEASRKVRSFHYEMGPREQKALNMKAVAAEGGGAVSREAAAAAAAAQIAWLFPDVVVCDPARAGLSTAVVQFLLASKARRCVYVSCNPATQARDLGLLCGTSMVAKRSRESLQFGPGSGSSWSSRQQEDTSRDGVPGAFRLASLQAVDMFPQTDHVETVAVLERL